MTATRSNAARRRLLPAAASAGLVFSFIGMGSALAQDSPAAAPPADSACAVERCLTVRLDPALRDSLRAGQPVSLDELAQGLKIDFQGEAPLAVRLVAARYDRGRLVRYGVSSRLDLAAAGAGLSAPDALAAVQKAFKPTTNRTLALGPVQNDLLKEEMPVQMAAFVGEAPSAYLAGEGNALINLPVADEDLPETFDGAFGVIVAIPDDDSLRAPEQFAATGALVGLAYDRPARTGSPTG
jgi:hypothetical protein